MNAVARKQVGWRTARPSAYDEYTLQEASRVEDWTLEDGPPQGQGAGAAQDPMLPQ